MIHKKASLIYIAVLVMLTFTTIIALMDGGYHIAGGWMAGAAFVSAITSIIPFVISRVLFKKYEANPDEKKKLKAWGLIIYLFCFPVKLWIIYCNIDLLIHGGGGWAFG